VTSEPETATERDAFLLEEIERKDDALRVAVSALDRLSKSGSLRREIREAAISKCREALNERIF
jgi:hypothetical protein